MICPTEGSGNQSKKTSSGKSRKKKNLGPWRKICPIKGCKSKPQVKLSNHL